MAESVTSPAEQEFPPRFWWLKRTAVGMLLFATVLVALRYVALHVARRRVAAEIAAIKARGEPLMPEDFLDRPVPADQDGGPDLLAAGKIFVLPKQYQPAWDQLRQFNVQSRNSGTVDAVLSANQQALVKVRVARGKTAINWGLQTFLPLSETRLPMLRDMRELADALAIAAQRMLWDAKDDQAVEYFRDWLMVSKSLETQPMLTSQLTASGMQERLGRFMAAWAITLQVGTGENAAGDAQVRSLIAELLEDPGPRRGPRWAWQGARMRNLQLSELYASSGSNAFKELNKRNPLVEWCMRPADAAGANNILRRSSMCVNAASAKDLPEALKIVQSWKDQLPVNLFNDSAQLETILNSQFEAVYFRREAAVALAARMFRLKYGRKPNDVSELVPEFLSEAPLDCLRGKGTTVDLW